MASPSTERIKLREQIKKLTKKGSWSCNEITHALIKKQSNQSKQAFDELIVEVKNITALLFRYGELQRDDNKRICRFSSKKVYFYYASQSFDQKVIWNHEYTPPLNLKLTRPNTWLSSLGVAA